MDANQILTKAGIGTKTTLRILMARTRRSAEQKSWFALGLIVAFAVMVVGFSLPTQSGPVPMVSVRGVVATDQGIPCPSSIVVLQGLGVSAGRDVILSTNLDGSYEASLPQGWTGTVMLDCRQRIQPVGRDFHALQADISRQDFVIFSSP